MTGKRPRRKKGTRRLKKWHKWVGLVFTFFLLMFAVSGIFLNHRGTFASCDIPRRLLPPGYRYDNWNNGSVRGTFPLAADSLLVYGNNGIWLTDTLHRSFAPYGEGMKRGADNNSVTNIVRTSDGNVFAATTFDLYRYIPSRHAWQHVEELDAGERLSDIDADDSGRLAVMGRSHIFIAEAPYTDFEKIELPAPEGYDNSTTWFRIIWTLHSGELFGIPGRLFVDLIGVLTIVLCITGIVLLICPGIIRRRNKRNRSTKRSVSLMRGSMTWHNKAGSWFLFFLLLIAVTGMCLRPPLMLAVVRGKTAPPPGSALDSPNPWHDKFRALRYDRYTHDWLLYASGGFYTIGDFTDTPVRLAGAPPVSVMGVNVLHQQDSTQWMVGSFSGLYRWNRSEGRSYDAFTSEEYVRRGGMPVFGHAVSGYSDDFADGPFAFEYSKGARSLHGDADFAVMPEDFADGRMSLWHLSLEVHVGRIYANLFGSIISNLWVFLSGTLFIVILLTGYILYRRTFRKNKKRSGKRTGTTGSGGA